MNVIKNLVFDLDGTIIEGGKKLSEASRSHFHHLFEQYNVTFASARPVRDMLPLIPDSLHSATFIGCNGGQAWKENRMIYSTHFLQQDIEFIMSAFKALSIPYILDGDWQYACSTIHHEFHDYLRSLSEHEISERDLAKLGVTKILALDGDVQSLFEQTVSINELSTELNIHRHTKDNFFDLTPVETNKAKALLALGLKPDETLSIGNDHNDFAMLKQSRLSIFVGHQNTFSDANYYSDMKRLFIVLEEALDNS